MSTNTPTPIKIYHITHLANLPAILAAAHLRSDAEVRQRLQLSGEVEVIGMDAIKRRRLEELELRSYPGLHVGACVPFYFCSRSVMLYIIHKANHPEIGYHGGQEPVIHLVSDLHGAVEWANRNGLRWAFTDSNAGSRYFNDFTDLRDLDKIDWQAVQAAQWNDIGVKEKKQAEFLVESRFPWELVEEIGVYSSRQLQEVRDLLGGQDVPLVKVQNTWYY